jgi:hypothetical protein
MWIENSAPTTLRDATLIQILKPGKDHSLVTSFRPISLTSYMCKTMEYIANHCLFWTVESTNILSYAQCGF